MSDPREVIISITNRCNLRCRMCRIPTNKTPELSTSSWKQVIKGAASCGAGAIVFSGGEPLLREDIFELISFTKSHSMGACLTSNGSLLQDSVAGKLKESGIDVVNISIEGPRRIHDYLRGKGMFESSISALENLRKHKIEATIATMVSRYNYRYLPYIMELAGKYAVTTAKFQPFSKIFLGPREGGESFFISDSEVNKITRIMHDVGLLSKDYAIATNPVGYLETVPFYLSGKYSGIPQKGCVALEKSCPINCNGDVYPCWVLTGKDDLIGNIGEKDFANIWDSQRHKIIIERIKNEGCPGCMMSCYDDNFGKDSIERKIIMNLRRMQERGAGVYARGVLKKWSKRLRFYIAYRGSIGGIINRLGGALQRDKKLEIQSDKEEVNRLLDNIEAARQLFKKEIERLK